MNEATPKPAAAVSFNTRAIWTVPNQLTVARLVLSIVCFVFLAFQWYATALVLFSFAAGTDWVDGYWARKYGQVTQLGRILDPFADKIIICGTFIFLSAIPASQIAPWMAVVVVGRELLVTALRSFFEERQIDFSARWSGKWKMLLQCLAVIMSLVLLAWFQQESPTSSWLVPVAGGMAWAAILITLYSGWTYVSRALELLRATTP